jgi:hypothetical protein
MKSWFFCLDNASTDNFKRFMAIFSPIFERISTKDILIELTRKFHQNEVKFLFVIAFDEIRKLEEYQRELIVDEIKSLNGIKEFEVAPILTAVDPSLLGSVIDLSITKTGRALFPSILNKLQEEHLKIIASKYSEEIQDLVLKALKLSGNHFRTVEAIDASLSKIQITKDNFITQISSILQIGFLFQQECKQEEFWKWICIPVLQVDTIFDDIFAGKRIKDFIVEGLLISDNQIPPNEFHNIHYSLSNLRTTVATLYNYSLQTAQCEEDSVDFKIMKQLNKTVVPTFTIDDTKAWELFNGYNFVLQIQCRSHLIDIKEINKWEVKSVVDLDKKLVEEFLKNVFIDKSVRRQIIEHEKKKKKTYTKFCAKMDNLDFEYYKKMKLKEFTNFINENLEYISIRLLEKPKVTNSSELKKQMIEELISKYKLFDEDSKIQLFTQSAKENIKGVNLVDSFKIIEENARKGKPFYTLELLSNSCSISIEQLFHYSLKIGRDFDVNKVNLIKISLVEYNDETKKFIPIDFKVDEDKKKNRTLAKRFKNDGFKFNNLYFPASKNEAGIDSLIGLKTIDDTPIFVVFQYRSRGNESQVRATVPSVVKADIDKVDLEKLSKSIGGKIFDKLK